VRVLVAAGLRSGLEAEGFAVDVAANGPDGLWRARESSYDAIVLDLMLPGMSGFKVCSLLRADGVWAPILILTAKDGEWDEVETLDTGADDFLTKPFSHAVLVARLRALMRRGPAEIELTARELAVLEYLLRRRGEAVAKRDVLDHVWDDGFEGDPNIVEVYIRHLRNKLDRPFGRNALETVRGSGYRLAADGG
jgi:two-component system, OmpR family, response regulator